MLRNRIRSSVAGLCGAFAAALGAQAPAAVPSPQRFERVLWCADGDGGPPLAQRLGFTAVQLGRGGDPAPLRALGLGYYVDQPIGKGLLELSDEGWTPVVQAYERTRDVTLLRRPDCANEPGRVDAAATAAADEVARVRGEGLLFVALADEASATRHDAPLDTCRCGHCLVAFRAFLQQRFGSIDACNRALGTHFADFAAVEPLSTDQVRRRELGERLLPSDLRPFSLWLEFVDRRFTAAVDAIARRVAAAVPGVPVGLTGSSVPAAFGGCAPALLLPSLTLAEPYDIGGAQELAASLLPRSAHRYATMFPPDGELAGSHLVELVRARLAALACRGLAGVVVWNDRTIATGDGPTPFGAALGAAFTRYGDVLDALAGASIVPDDVWLVESQPSVRVWWMLDSAQDGLTWVRRLASYEARHSTSQAARVGWLRLLADVGIEPRFVDEAGLAEQLLLAKPRCVLLPAVLALADRTAQALRVYVENGGTVIADHSTGVYDEQLLRRDRGALDELFGVRERSLAWQDLRVHEGHATGRGGAAAAAEVGLRGALGERGSDGDVWLERSFGRGRAVYMNQAVVEYPGWRLDPTFVEPARELRRRVRSALRRAGVEPVCDVRGEGLPTCVQRTRLRLRDGRQVLAIRLHALERPQVLAEVARSGEVAITVAMSTPVAVRALVPKDPPPPFARERELTARLDPWGALFFEVAF